MKVYDRFLKYVSFDTQSDVASSTCPSTEKQKVLALYLVEELLSLGYETLMDQNGYVYSTIPASAGYESKPGFALIAHMDTALDMSGKDIRPCIIHYEGGDIILNKEKSIKTEIRLFPELKNNIGEDLIITDGTTLLGADDKAGIAEIVTYAELLKKDKSIKHPKIQIIFTPDEEIGRGVDKLDLSRIEVPVGYTMDGGEIGQFQYETFNASSAVITIKGVTAHTGYAKGRIINSMLIGMEFQSMLPVYETPFCTEKREGFYHLNGIKGTVEQTSLEYSLRDHDSDLLEKREEFLKRCAAFLNGKYGYECTFVEIKPMYRNMGQEVLKHEYLINFALEAMEENGIKPEIQEVRGGTDGSKLSFMGLPSPNLCTGCHNGHSRHEYISIQSMEKAISILKSLGTLFAERAYV